MIFIRPIRRYKLRKFRSCFHLRPKIPQIPVKRRQIWAFSVSPVERFHILLSVYSTFSFISSKNRLFKFFTVLKLNTVKNNLGQYLCMDLMLGRHFKMVSSILFKFLQLFRLCLERIRVSQILMKSTSLSLFNPFCPSSSLPLRHCLLQVLTILQLL